MPKSKQKHLHFAGYDFTSGPEGTVIHRQSARDSAFRSGDRVQYRDVNLTQQGTVSSSDRKWVMVRWDGYSFESREWAPNLRHVSTGASHATKKKSPAQLQREIDETLANGDEPYYVTIGEGPQAHAREHRFGKLVDARAFALDASKNFPRRRAMVYRDEGGFDELLGHYEHGKRLA